MTASEPSPVVFWNRALSAATTPVRPSAFASSIVYVRSGISVSRYVIDRSSSGVRVTSRFAIVTATELSSSSTGLPLLSIFCLNSTVLKLLLDTVTLALCAPAFLISYVSYLVSVFGTFVKLIVYSFVSLPYPCVMLTILNHSLSFFVRIVSSPHFMSLPSKVN